MARLVGRITRGKISPSRACAQDEQYAVERLTTAAPRAATAVLPPLRFGDQGIQARPPCVSQVSSQRTHTSCSKLKLKRELDRARSANVVERVETAVRAAGPETVRQRLRRAAKEGAGQAVGGISEVWVVQDVEELSPESQPHILRNVKLPLERNIRLRSSESSQHVAPEITLLPGGRSRKSRLIENLATRISRPIEFKRRPRRDVTTGIEGDAAGTENGANDANGRSRSGENETVQRPAAQYSVDQLM